MLEFHVTQASAGDLPLHLVEEINHRVANEYAEAIAGLSCAAVAARPEVKQALRQAADRLRAHAETHRALLRPMGGQVNLADYLGLLCASFSRSTLAERHVRLSVETDEIWLASDRAWRLGLSLAELIRNAARHGLGGRAGAITVQIAESCGEVVCLVRDDGAGLAPLRPGRGVGLVRALTADLDGSAEWWLSPRGSLARLAIPTEGQAS